MQKDNTRRNKVAFLWTRRPPLRDRLSLGPGRQYGDQYPMGMREGLFAGLISRGRERLREVEVEGSKLLLEKKRRALLAHDRLSQIRLIDLQLVYHYRGISISREIIWGLTRFRTEKLRREVAESKAFHLFPDF